MALKRHKYPPMVKSLLHFDYDYPESVSAAAATSGAGGTRDEIGLDKWTSQGYTVFVGQEAPAVVAADTPKFGWRCPQFGGTTDCIKTDNASGNWNLKPSGKYEVDFFLRTTGSAVGNILVLRSASEDLLTLTKNASNQLVLKCEPWNNILVTSTAAISANTWHYLTVRIAGRTITVYMDQKEMLTAAVTSDTRLEVAEVRLGGFAGQIDEFKFMHTVTSGIPVTPVVPFAGSFDVNTIDGFGNGSFGDETLATGGSVQINTYAAVTAMYPAAVTVGTITNGRYGTLVPGNEVMVHLSLKKGTDESELGKYAFRRISRIAGSDIVFDRPILDEFDANTAAGKYVVQLVSVPNYRSLVVQLGTTVVPKKWDGSTGGVVVLKTEGNCTVNGKIISIGTGPVRTDAHKLTHADLAERFINTGNIFIACGAKLIAPDDARIGAYHAGDLTGSVGLGTPGENGGDSDSGTAAEKGGAGGKDGLPGFGGGGGQAGDDNADSSKRAAGGSGGGGGCDGTGGARHDYPAPVNAGSSGGVSCPNIILITKFLALSTKVVSTGGIGGGGGGCGGVPSTTGPNAQAFGGAGGNAFFDISHVEKSENGGRSTSSGGVRVPGEGGTHAGTGYGGQGGGGGAGSQSTGGYRAGGGGGGAGSGTGFVYISCEEMGYNG